MTATLQRLPGSEPRSGPEPMLSGEKTRSQTLLVKIFAIVPLLALAAAVPIAWGWGLGWVDVGLALAFYTLTCLGVTIGFHRYFTHRAFKANRPLRITLAAVGSMAMQGPVIGWVADHRRHHAYADREGDPHSPWLFGTSAVALAKGFWHAHLSWLVDQDRTNPARFVPDLLADRGLVTGPRRPLAHTARLGYREARPGSTDLSTQQFDNDRQEHHHGTRNR